MASINIDEKTLEKSVLSGLVALQQAYCITKRVNAEQGKVLVAQFLEEEGLKKLLGYDIEGGVKDALLEEVRDLLDKYKDKRDKSYTALLKLEEKLL